MAVTAWSFSDWGGAVGISTDGQLSFGVMFEEGFEFPWDSDEFGGDVDEWWRAVKGFRNPHPCPYGADGNYRPGIKSGSREVAEYHGYTVRWEADNPMPVQLVNYCSGSCPMYILAVKHIRCWRGIPCEIDPAMLEVSEADRRKLSDFLAFYGIEAEEPRWWLTSYWG